MVGIYRITSPSGGVYIGQSINIPKRWREYRTMITVKGQPSLYRSFLKHGVNNHLFEVIHELPIDVSKTTLDDYEALYMDQHRECGAKMLNIKGGGSYGKHCQETKDKISAVKKSKNFRHSDETKQVIREKRALQANIPRPPKGSIPWNKGLKIGNKCRKRNPVMSEDAKEKLRIINTGKIHSEETRKRVSENNARYWDGKKFSEEHRRRLSESRKGKPSPRKGVVLSEEMRRKMSEVRKGRPSPRKGVKLAPEQIEKMRIASLGRKHTPEARANMAKARIESWKRRKQQPS